MATLLEATLNLLSFHYFKQYISFALTFQKPE